MERKDLYNQSLSSPSIHYNITNFVDKLVDLSFVNVLSKSLYADLDDIDNPIKEYTEVIVAKSLHYFEERLYTTTVSQQEVILEDTLWFYFKDPTPIIFNKMGDIDKVNMDLIVDYESVINNPESRQSRPFMLFLELDSNIYQYRRKVLTLLEVTGFLGGIYEIFEIVFGIIIGNLSSWLFRKNIHNEIK